MRIAHNVAVDLERWACVGVAELPLDDFRRCSRFQLELFYER
jgi:hypothetical protein